MFEDIILNDLVSYMLAQKKKKYIPQRKNTTRSIQASLEVMEKEEEEKISKTCISLQGHIICNSRKF